MTLSVRRRYELAIHPQPAGSSESALTIDKWLILLELAANLKVGPFSFFPKKLLKMGAGHLAADTHG